MSLQAVEFTRPLPIRNVLVNANGSINTTCGQRATVLFSKNPVVARASVMLKISLLLCVVPTFGIIVRDPPPSPRDYKYSYDVQDIKTGDSKSQHEVRLGDIVTGAYTVLGPDGTKRTVEYTADDEHGFKAVISEEAVNPSMTVTQPTPVPQPIVTSYDLNALRYPAAPVPLVHLKHKANYVQRNPVVYFIPQNAMESRSVFGGGNYFIPAKKK